MEKKLKFIAENEEAQAILKDLINQGAAFCEAVETAFEYFNQNKELEDATH